MSRVWSPQQEVIFQWFERRSPHVQNLIVRARAGTGKTTVLIEGVKRAPEKSILICAFSKIIQEELQRRIPKDKLGIVAQTLHSVGFQCIRNFRDRIKVEFGSARADDLAARVCGKYAPDSVIKLVSKLHTKGREIAPHARVLGDLTEIAYNFDCEPDDNWAASGFDLEYIELRALEAMELASNVKAGDTIDGSDMIFLPVRNHWLTKKYDMVVVDEAQDMTTAQLEIAQGVLKTGGRMCVIGDDRQAIFGFRGADSDSLDRLKRELKAGELGLTVTYRCGVSIVREAQRLVPDFEAGPDNHPGEVNDLQFVKLVDSVGPGDFVLSRLNGPLVSLAMKFLMKGKRTRIAGRDIGKGLVALVRKFRATSVPDFLRKVGAWEDKEVARLEVQLSKLPTNKQAPVTSKIEGIQDKANMLISLAEGAKNIQGIQDRIESLFSDDGLGAEGMITCSSVHKAKGLEADRVFVLVDTLRNYNLEEKNIEYVALTRAKKSLFLVTHKLSDDQIRDIAEMRKTGFPT